MPMRGKRSSFRRFKKAYGKGRKKNYFNIRRVPRGLPSNHLIHYFKRTQYAVLNLDDAGGHLDAETLNWTYMLANTSTLHGTAGTFQLSQLPNYTEFTALYDMYRICGIGIRWIYNRNSSDSAQGASNYTGLPILHTVRDVDDGIPLTNLSDMRQYVSYRSKRLNQHKKFIKTGISQVIMSGAVTDTTRSVKSPWLDCTFPAVENFGIKWAIELPGVFAAPSSIPFGQLQIHFTYYLAFKTPR